MVTEAEKKRLIALPIILVVGAGLAYAGGYGGETRSGYSIFAWGVIASFVIQWVAFVPAYLFRTEKFFDFTGSITYISLVLFSTSSTKLNTRSLLLAVMVALWAARLGVFLFVRVLKVGEDSRFRQIKQSGIRFFTAWTLQGLWVSFTIAAALAAITSQIEKEFDTVTYIGCLLWVFGFVIEVAADSQKSSFRANPKNKGKYISTGLWAWSRHPNYFGEIVLWTGVAVTAAPVLSSWQFVTLLSPVFVTFLLTKVSGIPILERQADKRWGGQSQYQTYKKNTPVLILLPPRT